MMQMAIKSENRLLLATFIDISRDSSGLLYVLSLKTGKTQTEYL